MILQLFLSHFFSIAVKCVEKSDLLLIKWNPPVSVGYLVGRSAGETDLGCIWGCLQPWT